MPLKMKKRKIKKTYEPTCKLIPSNIYNEFKNNRKQKSVKK
jgi:hypothetical protein